MDCPFCGKEMKEGLIPARDRLQWRDEGVDDLQPFDAAEFTKALL